MIISKLFYDRIRIQIQPIQISEIIEPVLMKLDNPYSRLAYSRNQLRDLLTKEKSTIDFLLANISGIDNKKMMVFRNKILITISHMSVVSFLKSL